MPAKCSSEFNFQCYSPRFMHPHVFIVWLETRAQSVLPNQSLYLIWPILIRSFQELISLFLTLCVCICVRSLFTLVLFLLSIDTELILFGTHSNLIVLGGFVTRKSKHNTSMAVACVCVSALMLNRYSCRNSFVVASF